MHVFAEKCDVSNVKFEESNSADEVVKRVSVVNVLAQTKIINVLYVTQKFSPTSNFAPFRARIRGSIYSNP